MAVTRTNRVTLTGTLITVDDLRQFVADLAGADPQLQVSYNYYAGDQRDPSTLTMTVSLPVSPNRPPQSPALQFPPGAR